MNGFYELVIVLYTKDINISAYSEDIKTTVDYDNTIVEI
jgi:hypothetical protein